MTDGSGEIPDALRAAPLNAAIAPPPVTHAASRRWLFWVPVTLTALVFLPGGMMQCHYLPKTFWAACWLALGFLFLRRSTRAAGTRHDARQAPCPAPASHNEAPQPETRNLKPETFSLTPLGLVWLLYSLWILLSLTWAVQPRVGFERWLALLLPTFAYLLARRTRFWESDAFWTFFCVLIGAIALLGISQYVRDYAVRFLGKPFPGFVKGYAAFVDWFPGTAAPRGTMGQRNVVSMYLVISLPFIAWRYFRARGRQSVLAYGVLGAGLLLVLLARTRGAWLGLGCAGLGLTAAGVAPRLRACRARLAWLAGPAILAIGLALALKPPAGFDFGDKEEFDEAVGKALDPKARVGMWAKALGVTNPFLGAGFGNVPILLTARLPEEGVKTLAWEIHNDYLQAWLDLGVPGFLLFTGAFVLILRLGWKGRRHGLILAAGAAAAGLAAMLFTTYTYEKVGNQVWLAGVVAILNSRPEVRPRFSMPLPRAVLRLVDALIVLGLLGFAGAAGLSVRGDRLFRRTELRVLALQQLPPDRQKQARAELRREIEWLYKGVLPLMQFGGTMRQVYCTLFGVYAMECGDLKTGTCFVRKALYFHPYNRDGIAYLAKLAFLEGRREEGIALMERYVDAFGCDPDSEVVQGLLGIYRMRGEAEKADRLRERIALFAVTVPADPTPANRAGRVTADTDFDWSDCGGAETYDLYLWRAGEQTPGRPVARRLRQSRYTPKRPLDPDTVYFWRVQAAGRFQEKTGEIWFFRTEKP